MQQASTHVAMVTGAGGQDGYFLTERLLSDGWIVHAIYRQVSLADFDWLPDDSKARLHLHRIDLQKPQPLFDLIQQIHPREIYNLAGQSSVSESFSNPLYTWQTNTESVVHLLECIRRHSPDTRFYQASSTDMFGTPPHHTSSFNEDSALNPQSPYASAKAAAHLLCRSYREVYGLRIASGILSNHESHRRTASFLSRKVVEHVRGLKERPTGTSQPLAVGHLKVERDWGFAPDYVAGMIKIMRQIETRARVSGQPPEEDKGRNYRDYVLATGRPHAVWQLIDCAFTIAGFALDWNLDGEDPTKWQAAFRGTNTVAVNVNPRFLRAAEPLLISVDPARAQKELDWAPRHGLEVFLEDMLTNPRRRPAEGSANA